MVATVGVTILLHVFRFDLFPILVISIDPNLKAIVYQVGVAYGSVADWEFMWQRYKSSTDPYEKRLYLRALAESTEPWILSRYVCMYDICVAVRMDLSH